MLKQAERILATAGELDFQAESLSNNAKAVIHKLEAFKGWVTNAKAEAQSRHEAVVAALEEENKAIQLELSTMLSDLGEMLSDLEGGDEEPTNG